MTERGFERDRAVLERLRAAGVDPVALMVIPAASGDLGRRKAFGEWLVDESGAGRELFCHGLAHRAHLEHSRSTAGKWQNKLTDGEAEFAGLERRVGERLLDAALGEFRELKCGLPFGFVPPTWYAPDWLEHEVFRRGITAYEKRFFISRSGVSKFNFPLSMIANTESRFRLSVATAKKMVRFGNGALRLALHPVDFATPQRSDRMMELIDEMLMRHRPAQYAELLF